MIGSVIFILTVLGMFVVGLALGFKSVYSKLMCLLVAYCVFFVVTLLTFYVNFGGKPFVFLVAATVVGLLIARLTRK